MEKRKEDSFTAFYLFDLEQVTNPLLASVLDSGITVRSLLGEALWCHFPLQKYSFLINSLFIHFFTL